MSSKKPNEPSFPHKNPFKSQEAKGLLQSSEPSLPGPQGKNHPKSSALASHDPNRKKCCLGCYRYTKIALTDSLKDAIPSLFNIEIDFSDRKVPLGMCQIANKR